MKKFTQAAAQGEISIRRINELPKDAKPIECKDKNFIVGHSETGHHHTMVVERAKFFEAPAPAGMRVLFAILDESNTLVHQRSFDQHETINFEPGIYEFRSGREFDHYSELSRKQAD